MKRRFYIELDEAYIPIFKVCGITAPFSEFKEVIDAEQVRHGKYIGTEFDGYADGSPVYYEWKCSECGCVFEEEEPTYNYCPNCGARMDAQEAEE